MGSVLCWVFASYALFEHLRYCIVWIREQLDRHNWESAVGNTWGGSHFTVQQFRVLVSFTSRIWMCLLVHIYVLYFIICIFTYRNNFAKKTLWFKVNLNMKKHLKWVFLFHQEISPKLKKVTLPHKIQINRLFSEGQEATQVLVLKMLLIFSLLFYYFQSLSRKHPILFLNFGNSYISHSYMTEGSKAYSRDFCRCNFIFSISIRSMWMVLLMFKASERVTGWLLRAHNRLRWLDWGLAKSAARPLEEAECLKRNNETARSDAVLPQSHLPCQVLLAGQMGSINHLSHTLF